MVNGASLGTIPSGIADHDLLAEHRLQRQVCSKPLRDLPGEWAGGVDEPIGGDLRLPVRGHDRDPAESAAGRTGRDHLAAHDANAGRHRDREHRASQADRVEAAGAAGMDGAQDVRREVRVASGDIGPTQQVGVIGRDPGGKVTIQD